MSMTDRELREHYIGCALTGLLSNPEYLRKIWDSNYRSQVSDNIAQDAIETADAVMNRLRIEDEKLRKNMEPIMPIRTRECPPHKNDWIDMQD
jgi:hypothetical protein